MPLLISRRGMYYLPDTSHIIELNIPCALPNAHTPII